MIDYQAFLASKSVDAPACGLTRIPKLNPSLFPFQADIVRWALRRGRAAVFADTGLGKGWIALEWLRCVAEHTKRPAMLLAPLAVSHQFAREAAKLGVESRVVSDASEVGPGINVTNYHKLARFDASAFGAVAIDESSILKDYSAATRNALIQTFAATPFKLALTATPSPNDHTELGNHAEFLGVMTRAEMLSMFFVHDMDQTQDWRLKGHAQTRFWEWVASWAVALRRPSDLGYPDDAYALPPLRHHQHTIKADQAQAFAAGMLFAQEASGLADQRAVRRSTLDARVAQCASVVASASGPVVVWCDLNDEGDALKAAIPGAVQVAGSDSDDEKEAALDAFARGDVRVLISKPSICGWGLNWQHAHTVVFCGVTHSFEAYYQAVRRCWRFGQTMPVDVHVVCSELEGRVVESLNRKHEQAKTMGNAMVAAMADITRANIGATGRTFDAYTPTTTMTVPQWIRSEEVAA